MKLFFKPLFSNPLFWAGLIVRLFLLFTESHGVMKDFFIPFVDYGIQHPLNNPWNQLPAEYFPYGIVLYLFMALPKFFCHLFFGDMALGTTAISFALMKLPLLLFDLLFFKLLLSRVREMPSRRPDASRSSPASPAVQRSQNPV